MKSTGLVLKARSYIGSATPPASLEDESRFGNDGTFAAGVAAPSWIQLPSGLWVLSFDGSDDYLTCGHSVSLHFTEAFTLEAWVKSVTAATCYVMSKGWDLEGSWLLYLPGGENLKLYINFSGGIGIKASGEAPLTLDTWHHAVGLYDKNGTAILTAYLDGVKYEGDTQVGNFGRSDADVYVSAEGPTLDGHIALPRIYNRALSAAEIAARFQAERHWFGV